jgi:hypothetical protein
MYQIGGHIPFFLSRTDPHLSRDDILHVETFRTSVGGIDSRRERGDGIWKIFLSVNTRALSLDARGKIGKAQNRETRFSNEKESKKNARGGCFGNRSKSLARTRITIGEIVSGMRIGRPGRCRGPTRSSRFLGQLPGHAGVCGAFRSGKTLGSRTEMIFSPSVDLKTVDRRIAGSLKRS